MSAPGAPIWSWPVTVPLSAAYSTVMNHRNQRFDRGLGVEQLSRPVISVGNISVGGTGKSPMVAWIVQCLMDHGHEPVIAMRGYGSTPGVPGDEELEYRETCPSTSVVANPDRVEALKSFFADSAHDTVDCIVLDDGFQHRRVHRVLDLVLFDATMPSSAMHVVPWGRLREPMRGLRRADAVIVTRAPEDESSRRALGSMLECAHGAAPIAWAQHRWSGLTVITGSREQSESVEWLRGKRVTTMLGIGNPTAMERQIELMGGVLGERVPVRDHQVYDSALIERCRAACAQSDVLMVTGKDWVKLRETMGNLVDSPDWPVPVAVPQLSMDVISGRAALESKILEAASSQPRSSVGRA